MGSSKSQKDSSVTDDVRPPPSALSSISIPPPSPRSHASPGTPTSRAARRLGIAVDLSDESAYAVKWAVQNYLRRGDAVILIHVGSTSVLYGADWGSIDVSPASSIEKTEQKQKQRMEEELDAFTAAKARDLAAPIVEAGIPFKIHIVKDHDMKERLCLEVERLGLSAMIMGSRGFGSAKSSTRGSSRMKINNNNHHNQQPEQRQHRHHQSMPTLSPSRRQSHQLMHHRSSGGGGGGGSGDDVHIGDDEEHGGRLGSVSDYCVRHCCCPVVVVRYPDQAKEDGAAEEEVYHDATNMDKMR